MRIKLLLGLLPLLLRMLRVLLGLLRMLLGPCWLLHQQLLGLLLLLLGRPAAGCWPCWRRRPCGRAALGRALVAGPASRKVHNPQRSTPGQHAAEPAC